MADDLFIEDAVHLRRAQGWLELQNHVEAFNELEKVAPRNRSAPEVLELRWQIYLHAGKPAGTGAPKQLTFQRSR